MFVTPMEETYPIIDELTRLLQAPDPALESIGFQSMLAASIEALNRVLRAEEYVAAAAISLAQQEKLQTLIHEIQQALALLMGALREPGKRLLDLTPSTVSSEHTSSWWYALSEAIDQLEKDIKWLQSLTQSQEKDSSTWQLGMLIETMLQEHLTRLMEEAERWNP